ncbi:hypothetical protein [Halomonas huangheensis]|uniref:Uncharacterized protein n=1 Tax=Halomonas huangheensis TaxID=1178482 RepID=W1NCI4_9GAMM|nr:hypothetical protein [Halomonas huangheensis]ALM52434.1 hypothetical protein AR456_09175 [Halomonas huangheensis]ERL52645.1 hypothetical protein BJB45_18880 [Halomonas huangheensis]
MTEINTSQDGLVGNTVYIGLYDKLEEAAQSEEAADAVIHRTLEEHAAELPRESEDLEEDVSIWSLQWIMETLQGDFNPNMTVGQIAANAALGMIPVVDQLLDVRDVVANCKELRQDTSNQAAWLALMLTLVGLIPILGSAVKGVLKIAFLYVRHGTGIGQAIGRAVPAIASFIHADKVQRLVGRIDLAGILNRAANSIDEVKQMLSVDVLMRQLTSALEEIEKVRSRFSWLLTAAMANWLDEALDVVRRIQGQARPQMESAMGPLDDMLDNIQASLRHEADRMHPNFNAHAGTRAVHPLDHTLNTPDPAIIRRMTNAQKGLFGEIISDRHMADRGFTNLLPEDRQVRSLADRPRGRGIDGVYQNTNPPPPYVVTETKFRTTGPDGKSRYIDGDGTVSDRLLPMTKGSGKQMSDEWVRARLPDALDRGMGDEVALSGYEKWLMMVDESGQVIGISKLDDAANSIGSIPIL